MWCSWLPALTRALVLSNGPVLEVGIGHFSTPFIHEYCKYSVRELISLEDDIGWGESLRKWFETDTHRFRISGYSESIPKEAEKTWGVVFIDNSPGGKARSDPFRLLANKAKYVVVHDYHRENEEAIAPIIKELGMKHKVYNDYQPPTLLAWW